MLMRMIYDDKLAQAAYLIGCQQTGEAIVIDPQRDIDRYISLAQNHDLRISAIAETHIHADFLSGARELAEAVDARLYLSGAGPDEWQYQWVEQKIGGGSYDHRLLHDGDRFSIGKIEFQTIHTPGHTPEHICFLLTDYGGGATDPIGLVSGDFVFVGDLGRPDLLESAAGEHGAMEPAARQLFRSLDRLRAIPEYVQVWPAHGAGSACGKALGSVPTSTIGYELRFNKSILSASTEQGFVDDILSGQPEPPMYFADMKRLNRSGPAVLGRLPQPRELDASEFLMLDTSEVALIDTRPTAEYVSGHVRGSYSIWLNNSFGTDVGSLVNMSEPICLIINPGQLDETIRELVRIGYDNIAGWFDAHEMESVLRENERFVISDEVEASEAVRLLDTGEIKILDVRRATEYLEGHLEGAQNIAHTRLLGRLDELSVDTRYLVHCRSGERSARACSLLEREGFRVINLRGGMIAWEKAHPTGCA